jgi:hypothetical protein
VNHKSVAGRHLRRGDFLSPWHGQSRGGFPSLHLIGAQKQVFGCARQDGGEDWPYRLLRKGEQDMQYVILGIAGAVFVIWTDIRLGLIEKFVASKEPDFGPPSTTLNRIFVGILVLCWVAVILLPR